MDAEGRTTFANPAAERMLGWRIDELMGRVIHRVVHHSHEDGSIFPLKECPIYAAFRDASVKRVGEDWFWRGANASRVRAYLSSVPSGGARGQPLFHLVLSM